MDDGAIFERFFWTWMRESEHISKDFRTEQCFAFEPENVVLHDKEEVAILMPEWFV